jgi:hypothetical protein
MLPAPPVTMHTFRSMIPMISPFSHSRVLKNANLPRSRHPSSLRRTLGYASLLRISGAPLSGTRGDAIPGTPYLIGWQGHLWQGRFASLARSGRQGHDRLERLVRLSLFAFSYPRAHYMGQTPNPQAVLATLEVPCVDPFRPVILAIPEAHGSEVLRQQARIEEAKSWGRRKVI